MERITKFFDNKTVKVLAGDLTAGDWEFNMGILWGGFDQVNLTTDLKSIKVETEESAKNVAQTLGWAVVGNLVFGPLGLIAGLTMGGNRKQVCAMCELTDDRKFLAIMDSKIYQQMMALTMNRSN
jgi:hypothetical protein